MKTEQNRMDVVLVLHVTHLWPSGRCSTASFNTSFTSTTPSCKSESGEYSRKKWKREKTLINERGKKNLRARDGVKKEPLPKLIPLISDSLPLHDRMRNLSFSLFLKTKNRQIFVNPGFIITFVTFTVCFICFRLSLRSPFLRGWILRWKRGLEF